MERPLLIPGGSRRLYGVLFGPNPGPTGAGLVVCPPFADEALHAHRPLVEFCRLMARTGLTLLAFDYGGTGDSEGGFEEGSLDTYLEDIRAAVRFLSAEAGVTRSGLLSVRLGATLAIRAAGLDPALSPLILWAPVGDLPGYFRTFLRRRLFTEVTTLGRAVTTLQSLHAALAAGQSVDVQGYEISPAMAGSFARPSGANGLSGAGRPVLIAEVEGIGRGAAAERLVPVGFSVTTVGVKMEPFWELARVGRPDALYETTINWLAAHAR